MDRRFRTRFLVGLLMLVLAPPPVMAVGTVTVTVTGYEDVTKYSIDWTSDAGGAVSANALGITRGWIVQAQFIPGTGGTQPTADYDAVLNDSAGVDLLEGKGANLSNTTSKLLYFPAPFFHDGRADLDLVVSAAGASKTGTFFLLVRRTR